MKRATKLLVAGGSCPRAGLAAASIVACSSDPNTQFEEQHSRRRSNPMRRYRSPMLAIARSNARCSTAALIVRTRTGELAQSARTTWPAAPVVARRCADAAAADRSSNGCEFYLQPPLLHETISANRCYAAYVVNTSVQSVDLKLSSSQGTPLDIRRSLRLRTLPGDATLIPHTGPIAPGESVILFVSDRNTRNGLRSARTRSPCSERRRSGETPGDVLPAGTGIGASFHLTTNVPVSLLPSIRSAEQRARAVGHASSSRRHVGQQHPIVNAWERVTASAPPSAAQARARTSPASEDGTDVTIQPTNAIQDGNEVTGTGAQVPVTYRLDKGQVLQLDQAEELTGSVVTLQPSRRVLFGGHECMFISVGRGRHAIPHFSSSPPSSSGDRVRRRWLPSSSRQTSEPMPYRIVAARDGTQLDLRSCRSCPARQPPCPRERR